MLHKPKISTLKHLHSIPRYFMHSIPIGSLVALLTLTLFTINPSPHDTQAYAIEDTNVRDTISTTNSNDNNDLDTVEREDSTVSKAIVDKPEPEATLTITPPADDAQVTLAGPNKTVYRSHDVSLKLNDVSSYALTVSYAYGVDNELKYNGDATGYSTISGANNTTGDNMLANTWGYAWTNDVDEESNSLTYKTMPNFGDNSDPLISESNTENIGYNKTVNGKIVFAANFSDKAPAGHYTTKVLLSLAANPQKTTVTDWSELEYIQNMTPEICANATIGTSQEVEDLRDKKIYTIKKLDDGNCWIDENLKLDLSKANILNSGNSDLPEGATWPSTHIPSADFKESNTEPYWFDGTYQGSPISGYQDNYGYYYNWCAATAGSCNEVTESQTRASASICPKGWRLPIKGEYENLIRSGYTLQTDSAAIGGGIFPYAGVVGASGAEIGSAGYYWSSTAMSNVDIFYLNFENMSVAVANSGGPGIPIRCIAKTADDNKTIEDINDMLEMSPIICSNTAKGTTKALRDYRNTKSYNVTKLEDYNCWMTQNLALDISRKGSLTSENSNIAPGTTWPNTSLPSTSSSTDPAWVDDNAKSYWNNGDAPIETGGAYDSSYGYYYNWCAATAGNCVNVNTAGGYSKYSICPKGWSLPTKEEYAALPQSTYSLFDLSGGVTGGKISYIGAFGYYWSGTSIDASGSIAFGTDQGVMDNAAERDFGFSIRCIAR